MHHATLSIAQCITLACILEATAPKPGNVHRGADFEDLAFTDFLISAVAIGPAIETGVRSGVGRGVLAAVRATRELAGTNTNLGTVLLLAPMAAANGSRPLLASISGVLQSLTPADSQAVYEAIRLAEPAGLGEVEEMDVATMAPNRLLDAMRAASDRDLVARQYVNDYEQVLKIVLPHLLQKRQNGWTLTDSIIHTHIHMMAHFPDSLIARKCGQAVADESAERAAKVLRCGEPDDPRYPQELANLDFWLRADGHRRNPGTTADLIAAGLFAALRDALIEPPFG